MPRSVLTAMALLALAAPAASAFDIDQMTDNERAIFRSEIRDYLLENPEVLMEAIKVLEDRRAIQAADQEKLMLSENFDAIFNDGYSFVGGNPDGDITMVEFMDYRCGYCKRAFPGVEDILATDGNIRFVVKEFPILGEASEVAARYAIATKMLAGDAVYKELHDKMMVWNGDINEAALSRLSSGLDMDHQAVLAMMNDDEITGIIRKNRELASLLQIQGTPTFIVGETFVRGYAEPEQMREIVRLAREEQG